MLGQCLGSAWAVLGQSGGQSADSRDMVWDGQGERRGIVGGQSVHGRGIVRGSSGDSRGIVGG